MNSHTGEHAGRVEAGRKRRAKTRSKIIAAAFDIFGDEAGLQATVEDIAERAGVTRATFYNHFDGIMELREALSHEVTHHFLVSVVTTVWAMPDPIERSAASIRYYLRKAMDDRRWGWSMLNLSAFGAIFGAETYREAAITVAEGIERGAFPIVSAEVGIDILMGTSLAAMGRIVRQDTAEDYPEAVAGHILHALGVPFDEARRIAHLPLPEFSKDDQNFDD